MKKWFFITALLPVMFMVMVLPISGFQEQDFGLPELHTIKTVTLSPSYSCQSQEEFGKGYEKTALFLSDYSKQRNSPDLLFNGACGSEDYFEASTAGDDMSVVADLKNFPLENLSAHLAFNKKNVAAFNAYSKFKSSVKVVAGHTYAVLLTKSDIRGLFVFTVTTHEQNKKVDLRYAVKEYQIMSVLNQSPGFNWERKNQND